MNQILYRTTIPQGWLRKQLEVQAKGLSGHLDKMWPDVKDSAWIGGAREGWERVPYWLDGFIPLAHLLQDEDLLCRADKYISSIISRQQPDGWICPCSEQERREYDPWAVLLIAKVLALHCQFRDDPRVENALYQTLKNLYDLLLTGDVYLHDWGKYRWFEGLIPLLYLHARKPEAWMKDLALLLRKQGADYRAFTALWQKPMNKWTHETHIVNLCMMLKYEALTAALLGEEYSDEAEALWQQLDRFNGTAVGTFTGDECLAGTGNQQGTELCAVVELMYTCEWLYACTGKSIWADRLEKVAFNALPATFTDDMWAHQYVQMVNQPACLTFPGKPFFRTNGGDSHLFGLEPNYGCCTANLHQGWPKLALSAVQQDPRGLVVAHLLPVSTQAVINAVPVKVRIESDYPFRMQARITIESQLPAVFDVKLRIPGWCRCAMLDGLAVKPRRGHVKIRRKWQGVQTIRLELAAEPQLRARPNGLKTLCYGPLVFALPVKAEMRMHEYVRDGVERKFPYCDYELAPQSEWRYGFDGNTFDVEAHAIGDIPFSSAQPPLTIRAGMARVAWDWADGYDSVPAVKPESSRAVGDVQEMQLVPYGCTLLRMTEMPAVRR